METWIFTTEDAERTEEKQESANERGRGRMHSLTMYYLQDLHGKTVFSCLFAFFVDKNVLGISPEDRHCFS